MTRRDKYVRLGVRKPVADYRAFCDELRARVPMHKRQPISAGCDLLFVLPMPASWSTKLKQRTAGTAHTQKPDLDNLVKAVWDALLTDDACVSRVSAAKFWGWEGQLWIGPWGDLQRVLKEP